MNIFRFLAILFNLSKKCRLEPPATLVRGGRGRLVRARMVGCHIEDGIVWHDCQTLVIPVGDLTKLANCMDMWSSVCVII